MTRRSLPTMVATCAAITVLAACAQNSDKAGSETVVLNFGSLDEITGNGQLVGPQAFIDNLDRISGGTVKVEVEQPWGDGSVVAESDLVKAIAGGEVDGGWPATRAFANGGIHGLDAAEAPLTITNFAALKELVSSSAADAVLAELNGTGVVGLGLSVGSLRRPFASGGPLLGAADWQGESFRVFNSPIQAEAVKSLGGLPQNVGDQWPDEVLAGRLRGIEFDIPQYLHNTNTTEVGYITDNVVLWPKTFVLSISQKRFDSLTEEQQDWVRQAADQAVAASVAANYDENTLAQQLCKDGAKFIDASPDQLASMKAALRPVIDRLAADPQDGPILHQIQAIAAHHPTPDALQVPADCKRGNTSTAVPTAVPSDVSDLPDGVYRVAITRDDVAAAGITNGDGPAGTWTMTIKDGTYEVRCRPIANPGSDCGNSDVDVPLDVGVLRGIGNIVYFVPDAAKLSQLTACALPPSESLKGHCGPDTPYQVTWAVDGDSLTFGGAPEGLSIKPWQKIA